jgi:uncharacterized protein
MMKRGTVKFSVITIVVKDIDKALKDVVANGGKIIAGKMKVGEIGFSAYIKDSEGNTVGLFNPTQEM